MALWIDAADHVLATKCTSCDRFTTYSILIVPSGASTAVDVVSSCCRRDIRVVVDYCDYKTRVTELQREINATSV